MDDTQRMMKMGGFGFDPTKSLFCPQRKKNFYQRLHENGFGHSTDIGKDIRDRERAGRYTFDMVQAGQCHPISELEC